jgi:hypothetical protein
MWRKPRRQHISATGAFVDQLVRRTRTSDRKSLYTWSRSSVFARPKRLAPTLQRPSSRRLQAERVPLRPPASTRAASPPSAPIYRRFAKICARSRIYAPTGFCSPALVWDMWHPNLTRSTLPGIKAIAESFRNARWPSYGHARRLPDRAEKFCRSVSAACRRQSHR